MMQSLIFVGSETSSDNLANFAKAVEKINGMSDETDSSIDKPESSTKSSVKDTLKATAAATVTITDSSQTPIAKATEPSVFDINTCCESNTELVYFIAEWQDANKTGLTTRDKSSSIISGAGIVTCNPELFSLPANRLAKPISSDSSASTVCEAAAPQFEKSHQEVNGTLALCDFAINFFEQVCETSFL